LGLGHWKGYERPRGKGREGGGGKGEGWGIGERGQKEGNNER